MLAVYVSGHGFGHAVRTAAVLRRLMDTHRGLHIEVMTTAPEWIFPAGVTLRRLQTDVGLVQRDGLEHDEAATLAALEPFVASLDGTAAAEAARLRDGGVRVVLGDVPALAFEVATRLPAVGVAVANFSWDDIYQPFTAQWPAFSAVCRRLRASYATADLLLRLPFHLPMSAFRQSEDVALVARMPSMSRAEARRRLGFPSHATIVMLAFGGFDFPGLSLDGLSRWREFLFVRPMPSPSGWVGPNVLEMADRGVIAFPDALIACDAVITKPGYGMVADLLACRVPALFAERPRFAEYPVLADALTRHARALPISRVALESGDVGGPLRQLLALDRPWSSLPMDGAEQVARRLAELIG